jgi:hypothetical protein
MDELTIRALIRAAAAFAVTFVVGSIVVFSVSRISSDGGTDPEASGTPTGPSATTSPTEEVFPTWLMWIPGGIPDGVGPSVTTVPVIRASTTATADIAWLVRVTDSAGTVVDEPEDPYLIPIDVTGVEPAFGAFVPEDVRGPIEDLQPGEGLLSETSAALRSVGEGATLEFDTGVTVTIAGILPDDALGGYELMVTRGTGEDLGVTHERYVLFQVRPGSAPASASVAAQLLPYLPEDAPYYAVEVRSPEDVIYRRANDRELPLMLLKRRFGEFAAQVDPATGALTIAPSWVQGRIVSQAVPVLGTISCHRKALLEIEDAMARVEADGTASLVTDVGDCFDPTAIVDDPNGTLSSADFGAAIEINLGGNEPGEEPTQPDSVVQAMGANGFGWGGRDAWAQGALFRFRRPPPPIAV